MKKKIALILAVLIAASTLSAVSTAATSLKKVAKVKQTASKTDSVSIKWSNIGNVQYEVKLSNGKTAKRTYKNITKNKYKITNLKAGKTYAIKVRARKRGIYGKWSDVYKVITAPKIAYKWTKGKLKVKWSKVKRATSYNLKVELNFNKKKKVRFTKLKTNTRTISKSDLSGLSLNKVYNVIVLPYKNDEKLFSTKITTRDIEVVGHRGRMDIAPQNTYASFKEAYKSGYDSVEGDFWETKSGDLIISHGNILAACGSTADVRTLTAATIKDFPIIKGKNVKKYDTQYLPTVEGLIKKISEYKMRLYLHLKDDATSDNGLKKIHAALQKYKMLGKTTIITSKPNAVERIVKNKMHAGFICLPKNETDVKNAIKFAHSKSAYLVIFKYETCINAGLIKYAHSNKLRMGCYNINDVNTACEFTDMGADFFVTNKYYFN